MKKYNKTFWKAITILSVFAIIFSFLQSSIIFLFQGLTEDGYRALHLYKIEMVLIMASFFYTIFRNILETFIEIKKYDKVKLIDSYYTCTFIRIPDYIYYIATSLFMFLFMRDRDLDFMIYVILIFNLITSFIIVNVRSKSYGLNLFLNDFCIQNNRENKNAMIVKKEIKMFFYGLLLGGISTLPLFCTFMYFNNTGGYDINSDKLILNIVITVIVSILSCIFFTMIVEKFSNRRMKELKEILNKDKYWMIINILKNSYILFSEILYFCIMLLVIKISYEYAILIILFMNLINRKRIDFEYEPSNYCVTSISYDWERYKEKQDDTNGWTSGITTTTFKDSFGNYAGEATTYNLYGVDYTEVKDANGKRVGSGTSFEAGGMRHTTYKSE